MCWVPVATGNGYAELVLEVADGTPNNPSEVDEVDASEVAGVGVAGVLDYLDTHRHRRRAEEDRLAFLGSGRVKMEVVVVVPLVEELLVAPTQEDAALELVQQSEPWQPLHSYSPMFL